MRRNGIVEHIYVEPNLHEPLGKRIVIALNHALSKACLEDYDYLLRVDADVMLPKRFIEENLKVKADCVGTAGYAVLLKMNCFIKVFNGQFPEVAVEDTYIALKLLSLGYSVKPWVLPPILKRKSGTCHSWRYHFIRGVEMYKLGYEPLHVVDVLYHDLRRDLRSVFS